MSEDQVPIRETRPPYIPWKTFDGFIASTKKTGVPHSVDRSVKPSSMAGGVWGQLVSALHFLKLVDASGVVQPGLNSLVVSYGTNNWKGAVTQYVVTAYKDITDGLQIRNATPAQVDTKFRERGKVTGQMLEKSIRFYLHALRIAETPYSTLLTMRRERPAQTRNVKVALKKPRLAEGAGNPPDELKRTTRLDADTIPSGYMIFPLRDGRKIIVPEKLTPGDVKTVHQYLTAYVGVEENA